MTSSHANAENSQAQQLLHRKNQLRAGDGVPLQSSGATTTAAVPPR